MTNHLIVLQENEGEGALPLDTYNHVCQLMQGGNLAFRTERFEEVARVL